VEADNGYRGEPGKIPTPIAYYFSEEKKQKYKARARHKTCNRRFKHRGVLLQRFRNELTDHHNIFGSIVVLCGKYNQSSVFPVELCGFVPHNIIPKE
jgi:hypothetical protein